jgi:hypothetical protein
MATASDGERLSRRARRKLLKKGSGTFVYQGGQFVVTQKPTILRERIRVPKEINGEVQLDALNRIVYEHVFGEPILDHKKQAQMGGPPIYTRTELKELVVRDVKLPKGEPVFVANEETALKLRGMDHVEEVEDEAQEEAPKHRGRRGRTEKTEETQEPTDE